MRAVKNDTIAKAKKQEVQVRYEQLQPIVQKASQDPSPAVRSVALTSLAGFKKHKKRLLPTILDGLEDPNPQVRRRAARALKRLTGTRFPAFEASASPKRRKEAVMFIRSYFKDEAQTIQ